MLEFLDKKRECAFGFWLLGPKFDPNEYLTPESWTVEVQIITILKAVVRSENLGGYVAIQDLSLKGKYFSSIFDPNSDTT